MGCGGLVSAHDEESVMSGIKKRTVYYDDSTGVVRWADWARVTTGVGSMAEPYHINRIEVGDTHGEIFDFDFEDMIARIDEVKRIDLTQFPRMLSGGSSPSVNGGYGMPRIGK